MKIGIIMILLIAVTLSGSILNQLNSPERFDKFIRDVGAGLKEDIRYVDPNVTLEVIEAKPPEANVVHEIQETGGIIYEYQNLRNIIASYIYECQCKSVKIYLYDDLYYFVQEHQGINKVYIFDFRAEIYLDIITNTIITTSGIILALYIAWKILLFPNKISKRNGLTS